MLICIVYYLIFGNRDNTKPQNLSYKDNNLLKIWLLLVMVRYITFICEALNCLYPRLRNHNNGEEDAGQTDASNANKDGSETELVAEQKKQLGDGKAKKPKCAVVQTSYHLLEKAAK